jgi:hypothetical protein
MQNTIVTAPQSGAWEAEKIISNIKNKKSKIHINNQKEEIERND